MASPWKNAADAADYISGSVGRKRSRRFVLREVKAGRLKAAHIGGRGEILTRDEWLDEWVEAQVMAVMVRRGAS